MGKEHRHSRIFWISLLSLLMLFTAAMAWGCSRAKPAEQQEPEESEVEEEVEGETVNLTLYFRESTDGEVWLVPEERTVEAVSDRYRAAMEELIAGPAPDSGLDAVLPSTVAVLDIGVEDGILTVNVSKEILTDATQVGVSATTEGMALAAIANTLTEFDAVDKVRLLIEGMQEGMLDGRHVEDFWGHMGLPEYLERNEGVIHSGQDESGQGGSGATEWRGGIAFGTSPQKAGGPADGLKVASVRYYDHGSYFRAVFDVVRQDGTATSACPLTVAEWLPAQGGVKVAISGILEASGTAGTNQGVGDSLVRSIDFLGVNGGKAEYMIPLTREAPFFLHYMSDPMRVIVDLEKSPGAQPDV